MVKRLAVIAATIALAFIVCGCSSGAGSASASSASSDAGSLSASSATSSLFVSADWPEGRFSDIPAPNLSVEAVSTRSGDNFFEIVYENAEASEVEEYVAEVKNAGFTYVTSENKSPSSYLYHAQNNENLFESSMVLIEYTSEGKLTVQLSEFKG